MSDNMIQLKGDFIRKELPAAAAILPGQLVERDVNNKFAIHSGAGEPHGSAFAVEDELQGKTDTQAYATDDRVQVNYQRKGNEVKAILETDLGGTPVVIGDFLESAGNGNLRLLAATDRQGVGVALEAIDLTQSGDVDQFISIEIV